MEQPRTRHNLPKKKPDLLQNPQLTAAQMTLGRTAQVKQTPTTPSINPIEVLEQAEILWQQNDNLQSINLLKGLVQYLKGIKYGDQQVLSIIHTNLAVSYYKIGFLQQAQQEFAVTLSIIKDLSLTTKAQMTKNWSNLSKLMQKIKYDMLTTRIQLQTCILFSEMGKHEKALDHAKISCKLAYNMIYDIQLVQYQHLINILNKNKSAYAPNNCGQITCEGQENLINNIVIVDQLINATKDLKLQFISKEKADLLQEQRQTLSKTGKMSNKLNIEMLFELTPQNIDTLWVYKNKILDQIQMKFVHVDVLDTIDFWKNNEVIQKIIYLTITLYCYSTETRFMEKSKQGGDPSQVLDSEHWLSRSLELAYTFLPHEAPILNQILTVHDRFHGIDKQTIPQDKQVGGFFKVLRPLSKPKSTYSSKNSMCSPIMIRIQMPKLGIQIRQTETNQEHHNHSRQNSTVSSKMAVKNIDFANKTIDLQNITKNNKIRGLNGPKKYDLTQVSHSTIKHKHNTKIDFSQNLKNIYASRQIKSVVQHNKDNKMKINLTGISMNEQGQPAIKSMRRPHSYDKQIDKTQQIQAIKTQRKKRSSSLKRDERKKRSATSNGSGLKLDGLQMLPNPFKGGVDDDAFDFTSLSGRLSNIQTTKIGGNIFINNNINLYISKESMQQNGLNTKIKDDKTMYEVSKRQTFINKRRAQNSNIPGSRIPEFAI